MSRWERNRTSLLLDCDSHVFVKIVDVLEETLTKSSQMRQRDNSDNCFSGTQEKKITFIAPPTESPGVCLGLGIRFCYLWQTGDF